MPDDFECKQIFIAHAALWEAMVQFAARHNFYLSRIPDGANEDGTVYFKDDEDTTPTYAFMPKLPGDK